MITTTTASAVTSAPAAVATVAIAATSSRTSTASAAVHDQDPTLGLRQAAVQQGLKLTNFGLGCLKISSQKRVAFDSNDNRMKLRIPDSL